MMNEEESYKDGFRKPQELLAFAKLKPSDKVLDVTTGYGYLAKHMALVTTDHVIDAQNGSEWRGFFESVGIREKIQEMEASSKIRHVWSSMEDPAAGKMDTYDLITMQNTYHDLYDMPVNRCKFFRSIYRALKQDGRFLLVDHQAAPGRGAKDAGANRGLHRIEQVVVEQELKNNGFVVVATSDMFLEKRDTHRGCAWTDPMRNTDRFVLLCEKVIGT